MLLHGDFGPQNMLFDEGTLHMQALVDWEFTHAGDPVEDLAWAEWIVRTHHPHLAKALDALFAGYGHRPTWQRRQNAMLDKCRWALRTSLVGDDQRDVGCDVGATARGYGAFSGVALQSDGAALAGFTCECRRRNQGGHCGLAR